MRLEACGKPPLNAESAARLYYARIGALRKLHAMNVISRERCLREVRSLKNDLWSALRAADARERHGAAGNTRMALSRLLRRAGRFGRTPFVVLAFFIIKGLVWAALLIAGVVAASQ